MKIMKWKELVEEVEKQLKEQGAGMNAEVDYIDIGMIYDGITVIVDDSEDRITVAIFS